MSDPFDDAMAAIGGNPAPSQGASRTVAQPAMQSTADYSPLIEQAARTHNVDPNLIRAMIQTESNGNPKAVSSKGATGLMQIDPSNYKALGITDPTNPAQNINGGAALLSNLLDRYGSVPSALTHYVGGDDQSQWGPQTQAYPGKVLANYQRVSQSAPQTLASAPAAPQRAPVDAFDSAMSSLQASPGASPAPAQSGQQAPAPGFFSGLGRGLAGAADTLAGIPGAVAQQGTYTLARASGMTPAEATAQAAHFGGAIHPVGNAFGVTNTPEYQNEASQRAQKAVGGVVGQGVNAVANATGAAPQDVGNMAGSLMMAAPGAIKAGIPLAGAAVEAVVPGAAHLVSQIPGAIAGAARGTANAVGGAARAVGETARDFGNAVGTVSGLKGPEAPALTNEAPISAAGGRGSVGAAGTSFAQQAAAEGVPDALVQKIAQAEQAGTLNATAASRHIEAGSLPVPVELTAGQASGDIQALSNEMNSRGKNPELALRFNAQNGQINDNLTALRDQVAPNVNVPSGAPTGQALVDAYKQMDEPITQQISEQYARARGAEGTPALVNAAPQMRDFASQVGPTRFNALPANVQQIFRDAVSNQVSLPAGFEVGGSNVRPMNVGDLMDIDKTLSGAMRGATDGTVRHDIGALRDSIVNSQLDPSAAGADAFSAYKTAQASARARFQAMDADPAYKAAVGDITPAGEPSPLADDFARKFIAGGKPSNVQNMMQNLSNDPVNRELVASALMDHLRAQAGVDLRTGSGNISQAGLNKAIQNLGDKTRIVLGPEASQTVEKLGNVARYTQEQPRGSFVNNSNTFVATAANAAKSAAEGAANVFAHGVPVGTWTREALARRSGAKEVAQSLEPGAGLTSVPLNQLLKKAKGKP